MECSIWRKRHKIFHKKENQIFTALHCSQFFFMKQQFKIQVICYLHNKFYLDTRPKTNFKLPLKISFVRPFFWNSYDFLKHF